MALVHIGFGSYVAFNRALVVLTPGSAPIRRLVQEARDRNLLVDATCGRRTKAVIVLDNGQLVLAAIQPETIALRLGQMHGQPRGGEPVADGDVEAEPEAEADGVAADSTREVWEREPADVGPPA